MHYSLKYCLKTPSSAHVRDLVTNPFLDSVLMDKTIVLCYRECIFILRLDLGSKHGNKKNHQEMSK